MIDMNEQEIQLVSGGNPLTPDPSWYANDPLKTDPCDQTVEEAN